MFCQLNLILGKLSRFHLDLSRGGYGKISVVPSSETYGANDVQLCAVNDTKYGYEVIYWENAYF